MAARPGDIAGRTPQLEHGAHSERSAQAGSRGIYAMPVGATRDETQGGLYGSKIMTCLDFAGYEVAHVERRR
jgi:hypothetical protein